MPEDIQIEVILGADNGAAVSDKVRQAYPKINRNFQRLKARHLTLEERVNNIVAGSGDDITELVDARQPATGPAYDFLKERLDAEHTGLVTQLADLAQEMVDGDAALAASIETRAPQTALDSTNAAVATKAAASALAAETADRLAEVAVERGRIDTIIAPPPGVDNAETADIRTGADGSLFAAAGGAVRGQINKVSNAIINHSSDLADMVGNVYVMWQLGGASGGGVPTTGGATDTRIHSKYLTVSAVDKDVTISVASGAKYTVHFYGTSGWLGVFPSYRTTTSTTIVKNAYPLATYIMIVVGYTDDRSMTSSDVEALAAMLTITRSNPQKFDSFKNTFNTTASKTFSLLDRVQIPMTAGANINLSANVGDTVSLTPEPNAGWNYAIVNCSAGDLFTVSGVGGATPRIWGFINASNQLISKAAASITLTEWVVVAPTGAAKLIINNNGLAVSFTGAKGVNMAPSGTASTNITTGVSVGSTVDMTPQSVVNWRCFVLPITTQKRFLIRGIGGGNPRLWAFVDSSNVLLSVQSIDYQYVEQSLILTVPPRAAKLICNFNLVGGAPLELYDYDGLSLGSHHLKINKNTEDIAGMVTGSVEKGRTYLETTPDDTVASFVKGIKFADELKAPITDFAKPGDLMVHVSSFCIISDVVYMTYYANTTSSAENPAQHIARFAYCSLSDLGSKTFVDLCNIGDTIDGKTVTAIYDTILLRKDDATLYLMWTVALNGEYYRVYKTFDVATGTIGSVLLNTFTVGATTNTWNTSGMTSALTANNVSHKSLTGDIGIMQRLSTRVEGGVTYYYTGAYVGPFNCIIKSSDLINWIFVAQPDFANDSQWENSVYVVGDKAFYFCRQYGNSKYGFLSYYSLVNGQWSDPVVVYDAQSRSDFFEHAGKLYLLHAPKDRNHLAIMEVNQAFPNKSVEIQVAKVPDYFYPYVQAYGGELYMSFTQTRQHIWLSKFTIDSVSTDSIISRFRELFLT